MKRISKSSSVLASLFALMFMFATAIAWAQTGTTSLRGVITDASGGVIADAKVTLNYVGQASKREALTDGSGAYEFLSLQPGTYTLMVEKPGFLKYEVKNLQLLVNTPATENVFLEVGSLSETVEVTSEAAAVNTADASLGIAFGEKQVKQLPLEARNVPELLSLQAGVAYTGNRQDINRDVDTRSGAVNGAHSDQSNITLDGVDVNDETRGYAFTSVLPITLDSVQEFRVTTSNYNADEGRSSGAQVSLITKSGSNTFHGSLYEYHRNTVTSANDYFVKLSELSQGQPNEPPKLLRNIFGASLGGPVWKDRLFFFANFEGYRQREQNSVVRIVPSAAMRDGVIMYQCADPSQCGGGSVQGVSGSHPVPAGFFALSPSQISSMDPLGRGPNGVMRGYLNGFPLPNDVSVGDGVNYTGYRFRGSVPTDNNWYIARADYNITANASQTLFWRGAMRNDARTDVPYLPGQAPVHTLSDFSKGFTLGYTALLRPTLINNFHWGFTRQSLGDNGNSSQAVIYFRGLNDNSTANNSTLAITRSRAFQVPVHNLVDDISWSKGKHTFQFGTNIAFIRNPRTSLLGSFSDGSTNASWLDTAGMANSGVAGHMDPGVSNFPAVDPNFNNSYDYPMMTLLGAVTQVDAVYNYNRDGSVLPQGAPVQRHFAADSYEFYAQDTWKMRPNFTLTYGLRYSLFSPPWETNGLEVAPTMNLGDWFSLRNQHMLQGIGSNQDPLVSFDLAGPANGKNGLYNWDYHDFAPRLALAYSPQPSWGWLKKIFGDGNKSTIRAGFGIVYDHIGQGLLNTFDRRGAFGMASTLTNGGGIQTLETAPRLTSLQSIPSTDLSGTTIFAPAPPGQFPQTFPSGDQVGAYAATWGLDSSLKTPYSYTLDFSIGRELPKHFYVEASYVGRLSHRLLAEEDLAQPLNLVDPKSKIDYYTAVTALAKIYRSGVNSQNVTPSMVGPTAAYWTNMLQPLQAGGAYRMKRCTGTDSSGNPIFMGTTSPLQAAYDLFCGFSENETTAIQVLDQAGIPDFNNPNISYFSAAGPNAYVNSQYASLYAWRSIGTASYNALQLNLRKLLSNGVQFDFNYTFSKSLDLESDAERVDLLSGANVGLIINAWNPKQLRGVSDFDTTHQFNANWIVELPFGKGKLLGTNAHGVREALIGGWQLSGLTRWTSGFPVNILNGARWPTNWDFGGNAFRTGTIISGTTKNPDGSVNLFPNPTGPNALGAFRPDFPGESGVRNAVRGDGFSGLDLGLSKRWKLPLEGHSVQFRWEVFNVPNLTRFDVQSVATNIDSGSFGNYTGLLTNPRVMQFALRYEF